MTKAKMAKLWNQSISSLKGKAHEGLVFQSQYLTLLKVKPREGNRQLYLLLELQVMSQTPTNL